MNPIAKSLNEFKVFPRLGAVVFIVLTVHVVNVVVRMATEGHTLTDIQFGALTGLVAVMSGASIKTLDYLGKQEKEN